MIAVVQRVKQARVTAAGEPVGEIGPGVLVLLGVARGDTDREADYLSDKIVNLRIFEDDRGKMNRSLLQCGGSLLVVSQFTLLGDCRKGRRPSFIDAAPPAEAQTLYRYFSEQVRSRQVTVATGRFGAEMQVALVNDGPVTVILASPGHLKSV